MSDCQELRSKIATASRVMYREGIVEGFGQISARLTGTQTFLIPRRMSPALVTEADLLLMNFQGDVLEGTGMPNTEYHILASGSHRHGQELPISSMHRTNLSL